MMKTVLEEISLRSDEEMREESAKMFAELNDVKHLHLKCWVLNPRDGWTHAVRTTQAAKPCRHELGVN